MNFNALLRQAVMHLWLMHLCSVLRGETQRGRRPRLVGGCPASYLTSPWRGKDAWRPDSRQAYRSAAVRNIPVEKRRRCHTLLSIKSLSSSQRELPDGWHDNTVAHELDTAVCQSKALANEDPGYIKDGMLVNSRLPQCQPNGIGNI